MELPVFYGNVTWRQPFNDSYWVRIYRATPFKMESIPLLHEKTGFSASHIYRMRIFLMGGHRGGSGRVMCSPREQSFKFWRSNIIWRLISTNNVSVITKKLSAAPKNLLTLGLSRIFCGNWTIQEKKSESSTSSWKWKRKEILTWPVLSVFDVDSH